MRKSEIDKFPFVAMRDAVHECVAGWDKIAAELQRRLAKNRAEKPILVVDCYPGVDETVVLNELQSRLTPNLSIHAAEAYHSPERIEKLVAPFLGGDNRAAGSSARLSLVNFFNAEPLWRLRRAIDELKNGLVLVVGCGASLIAWGHVLVYADLTRRQALQRLGDDKTGNFGADNQSLPMNLKCKRAVIADWPVADRWKGPLIKRCDYLLDTNDALDQKLADGDDVRRGLHGVARRPFRLKPFFDATLAGGEPPKEVCDADVRSADCGGRFDCALTENSLVLGFGDLRFELPAVDLLITQPPALLGESVHRRFGHEFPIPFDILKQNVTSRFEPVAEEDGWREERLRPPDRAFIEMRRHWFIRTVVHDTHGSVNVLNLAAGEEAIIESPDGAFEPIVVHHTEMFIIPAAVGRYHIRPHGRSVGKEIATIKAFVADHEH